MAEAKKPTDKSVLAKIKKAAKAGEMAYLSPEEVAKFPVKGARLCMDCGRPYGRLV